MRDRIDVDLIDYMQERECGGCGISEQVMT